MADHQRDPHTIRLEPDEERIYGSPTAELDSTHVLLADGDPIAYYPDPHVADEGGRRRRIAGELTGWTVLPLCGIHLGEPIRPGTGCDTCTEA